MWIQTKYAGTIVAEAGEYNSRFPRLTPEQEKNRIAEQVSLLRIPLYLKWTAPKPRVGHE